MIEKASSQSDIRKSGLWNVNHTVEKFDISVLELVLVMLADAGYREMAVSPSESHPLKNSNELQNQHRYPTRRLFEISKSPGVELRPCVPLPFKSGHELEALLHENQEVLLDETVFIFSQQPHLDIGHPNLLALDVYDDILSGEISVPTDQ